MNLLPVAHRELGVMARRARTYYLRNLFAVVAIALVLGMLFAGFGGMLTAASAGQNLFLAFSALAGLYAILNGVAVTADCLGQEKRDGTLGLLFLTDLRGFDIVAGKLVSRAGNAAYGLLAAMPVLGIAPILGGVRGEDYARMFLALSNSLFYSASFGVFVSTIWAGERRALNFSMLGVLFLCIILPALAWAFTAKLGFAAVPAIFLWCSPTGAVVEAAAAAIGSGGPGSSYAYLLAAPHLLAWFFLVAAGWLLDRTWRSESDAQPVRSRFWRNHPRPVPKSPVAAYFRRHRRLEPNPLLWSGSKQGVLGIWLLLLAVCVGGAGVWLAFPAFRSEVPVYLAFVIVLNVSLLYSVILSSCRAAREDQRGGAMEILLTTPLGAEAYLRGRLLSLKRQTVWPFLFVILADLVAVVVGCSQTAGWSWEWIVWAVGLGFLTAKLSLDLYAASWIGFWQGFKSATTMQAVRRTLFYLIGFRWLMLLCVISLLGLVTGGMIFRTPAGFFLAVSSYFILLVTTMLHYFCAALSELRDDLRLLASGRT